MKVRRAIVAFAIMAPALACQLLVGIDDDRFSYEAPPAAEGGMEGAVDGGPSDPCLRAVPPSVPAAADLGEDRTFAFALSRIDVQSRTDAGEVVGYDLDGVCTCDLRTGAARGGGPSCRARSDAGACDEDAGVDNVLSNIFEKFAEALPDASEGPSIDIAFNRQAMCGTRGLLFVVTGYNGLKDDSSVVLFPVESGGIRTAHDGGEVGDSGCSPLDASDPNPTYPAKLDGTDRWSYPSESLARISPPSPKNRPLARGWVRDFVLVVDGRSPGNPISLSVAVGSTVLTVSTGVLTARLVALDERGQPLAHDANGDLMGVASSFLLEDGTVAGRAATKDMLNAVRGVMVGKNPRSFICDKDNETLYRAFIKPIICNSADTLSVPEADFVADSACDALSLGLRFSAAPAGFGAIYDPPNDGGCAAADVRDSCDY